MVQRQFNDVEIVCVACGARLLVRRGRAGLIYKCPKCREILNLDAPPELPAAEPVMVPTPTVRLKASAPSAGEDYKIAAGADQPAQKHYFPITCPTCHTRVYAEEDQVGQSLTCPDCHRSVIVPPAPMRDPTPPPVITDLLDDHYKVCPGVDQPPAGSVAHLKHFAVVCPLCHTRMSATEEQIGQTLTCPDCRRPVKVTRPPVPKPTRRWSEDDGVEIPIAATFERPMVVVPLHESAVRPKPKRTVSEAPPLPSWPLVSGVFTFPGYRDVWPLLLGYGAWLGAMLCILHFVIGLMMANSIMMVAAVFLLKLVAIGCGFWWFATSSLFLTIIQDTSDGLDRVENWPDSIFLASELGDPFYLMNAAGLALMGGGVLITALGAATEVVWLVAPLVTIGLFPLFLLSMLANVSPMSPFSRPVWSGVMKSRWSWGAFYLESIVIFGAAVWIGILGWREGTIFTLFGAAFAIFAAMLIYYRLLGRLAWITALQPDDDGDDEDPRGNVRPDRALIAHTS